MTSPTARRRSGRSSGRACSLMVCCPRFALLLALAAGYFKWVDGSADDLARARTESVRVAGEDAVALLSYKADSVEKDLGAARERLTGEFKDAYTELTRQVVIPGAKEKHISSVAKVNAAASVSATANHAVVLLFVNQTVTIGDGRSHGYPARRSGDAGQGQRPMAGFAFRPGVMRGNDMFVRVRPWMALASGLPVAVIVSGAGGIGAPLPRMPTTSGSTALSSPPSTPSSTRRAARTTSSGTTR